MATTWIKPLKSFQGQSTAESLKDIIDYVIDSEKTTGSLTVGYACDPLNAAAEFEQTQYDYTRKKGYNQGENSIIAYHLRQSFKPGEITPELASELGQKLAMELTNGNHSFVIATHTDQAHLHNHIIINSINLEQNGKFRNPIGSSKIVRAVSDKLCEENNLSVIVDPDLGSGRYKSIEAVPTAREKLAHLIDDILSKEQPQDFTEFIKMLEQKNCQVKQRGKSISVKLPNKKRFIRLKATKGLFANYTVEAITKRIKEPHRQATAPPIKIKSLIDLENSIKAAENQGFKNWATAYNIKQAAETLLYLQQNNFTDLSILQDSIIEVQKNCDILNNRIAEIDGNLKNISALQKHIGAYAKDKTNADAKNYFNSLGLKKLPSIKDLKQEYASLLDEKRNCYSERKNIYANLKNMIAAKSNINNFLDDKDNEIQNESRVQHRKFSHDI